MNVEKEKKKIVRPRICSEGKCKTTTFGRVSLFASSDAKLNVLLQLIAMFLFTAGLITGITQILQFRVIIYVEPVEPSIIKEMDLLC